MDHPPNASNRSRGDVWLTPSQALERFEPPEPVRLQSAAETRKLVRYGYRVGTLCFLISSGTGSEVVPLTRPAPIPSSPRWLLGLVNLRGTLVPVFDVSHTFGLGGGVAAEPGNASVAKPMILVLDKGDRAAGLLINGFPCPLSGLRSVPQLPLLPEALRAHVAGAWADDTDIWLELGLEGLLLELGAKAERPAA